MALDPLPGGVELRANPVCGPEPLTASRQGLWSGAPGAVSRPGSEQLGTAMGNQVFSPDSDRWGDGMVAHPESVSVNLGNSVDTGVRYWVRRLEVSGTQGCGLKDRANGGNLDD